MHTQLLVIEELQLTKYSTGRVMAKIKITQVRSIIRRPERQKRTMQALGLRKINASVEVEATDQILGMVNKVKHLVKTENI